ncbi:hypothetical protein B8A39_04420 [Dolosigranulum pigrum]|jgi:hypothetical protein|uniref:hypothetical protein n=1 Tax=Dolosigranulum pigrum TaxID=29394 RepID=UPI000DBFB3BE|nr:hypothetical protein [Dolosigranulum pigrum]RAN52402.1 hypothetical protein B8A39_04420 [Dolosigranulum pigrum]
MILFVEKNGETSYCPRVKVESWKIYFTHDDVINYLQAAYYAGAPAVIATLTGLGSGYPVIGNIASLIVGGVIGTGSLMYIIG